ncbi:MAG: hypothetical protein R2774_02310 [Saprospiraceae bacterium]
MLKLDSFKSIGTKIGNVIGGKAPSSGNDQPKYTYTVDGINGNPVNGGGITHDTDSGNP